MNAELIKALRESKNFNFVNFGDGVRTTEILAADALEAADRRIAELEAALQNWHEDYHDKQPPQKG